MRKRDHWRDFAYSQSRYNCEANCPHLRVTGAGGGEEEGYCDFYDEELAHDGTVYGEWFMCGDCVEDAYGGGSK